MPRAEVQLWHGLSNGLHLVAEALVTIVSNRDTKLIHTWLLTAFDFQWQLSAKFPWERIVPFAGTLHSSCGVFAPGSKMSWGVKSPVFVED